MLSTLSMMMVCWVSLFAQTQPETDFTVGSRCEKEQILNLTTLPGDAVLHFDVHFVPTQQQRSFLWPVLEIELNGVAVEPMLLQNGAMVSRLVNKPLEYQTRGRGLVPWNWGSGWLVMAHDSFNFPLGNDVFLPPDPADQGDIFRFELNVSDLVQEGDNQIVLRNVNSQYTGDLIFADFGVAVDTGAAYSTDTPPVGSVAAGYTRDALNGNFTFTVAADGTTECEVNGERFHLTSRVIWPSDPTDPNSVPYCDLVSGGCWASFAVDPNLNNTGVIAVTAEAPDHGLTLVRTFTIVDERIRITDTLTTSNSDAAAVHIENRVVPVTQGAGPGYGVLGGRRMQLAPGGQKRHLVELHPHNPTVFLPGNQAGMGLAAVNDNARIPFKAFVDDSGVVMRIENMLVPAESSPPQNTNAGIQTAFDMYPTETADEYIMFNRVRADWNLNYAMDGRLVVLQTADVNDMNLSALAERLHRNRTRYVVLAAIRDTDLPAEYLPANFPADPGKPMELHGHGFNYALQYNNGPENVMVKMINDAAARLKSIDPNIQVLFYFNTFLTTEDETQLTHDWYLRNKADVIYEYVKHRVFYSEYGYDNASQDGFLNQVLTPMMTGMVNRLEVDGLFWDLFSGAGVHRSYQAPADSNNSMEFAEGTLDVTPYFEMIKASGEINRNILDQIYAGGKFVITNEGAADQTMLEGAVEHRVVNVHENNLPHRMGSGLLSTPLAFRIPEISPRHVMANLRHTIMFAMLYSTYIDVDNKEPYDILQAIHPFEPREVHRGYLLGKNKIISVRPGTFGWDAADTDGIRVTLFNEHGVASEVKAPVFQSNGRLLVDIEVPWGSVAVLTRRGIETAWRFEETSGTTVSAAQNGPTGTLSGGAVLGGNGRIGRGLSLDGSGQVALATHPALQATTFSVSAWVKPNTGATRQPLFGWDGEAGLDVAVNTNGTRTMRIQLGPQHWRDFETPANLFDGNYHHVVMAADTGAGLASAVVYVDGVAMKAVGADLTGLPVTRGAAAIGALGSHRFNGDLDEVRLYNYLPSSIQAETLYREAAQVGVWQVTRDAQGWSLADTSSYGNHPSSNATVVPTDHIAPAPSGFAFDYSPARSDYLRVTHDGSLLEMGRGFSVSAWVNARDLDAAASNGQTILNMGDWNTANQYYLGFYQNHLRFVVGDVWARGVKVAQNQFSSNTWYHLVGTADADGHRLYVNGVRVAESSEVPTPMSAHAFDLFVGRLANSNNGFFDGLIADPRVEMRVLADAEIAARYMDEAVAAVWTMDETAGNVAFDSSGRSNHAAFVNGFFSGCEGGESAVLNTVLTPQAESYLEVTQDQGLGAVPNADGGSGNQLTLVVHGVSNAIGGPDDALIYKTDDSDGPGYYLVIVNSVLHLKHGNDKLWAVQGHPLASGEWFHIAAVIDNGTYRIYLDGEEVSLEETSLNGPTAQNADGFYLGGRPQGSWLQGSLAEARVYRAALQPGMIADLADAARNTALWPIIRDGALTGVDLGLNQNHLVGEFVDYVVDPVDGTGHALFDAGSYLRAPHHPRLNPVDAEFTVSARIRWAVGFPEDEAGVQFPAPKVINIVSKGNWNECNFYGLLLYQNRLRFSFGQNWAQGVQVPLLGNLVPDQWYTITGVVTGGRQILYINGQWAAEQPLNLTCTVETCDGAPADVRDGLPCNTAPFQIGNPDERYPFEGNIEAVSVRQYAVQPEDMGLIGHWRLNGNGRDESRLRNHAQVPYPYFVEGAHGHALDLEHDDVGNVAVAHHDALNPSGDFTLSAWIKLESLDSVYDFGDSIVAKGDWNDDNNYYLGFYQGKLRFNAGQNWAGGLAVQVLDSGVVPGKWFLVTGVRQGEQLTLYVNGDEKDSKPRAPRVPITNQQPLILGGMSGTSKLDGLLDDVRFYNHFLTQAEVQALWQAGPPE